MLKAKAVIGADLDTFGQFEVTFDEGSIIASDFTERAMTGPVIAGGVALPMTNTLGFAIGQIIVIHDAVNSETRTITAMTAHVSLTVAATTNAYSAGALVTVIGYAPPKVAVELTQPFTDLLAFMASWKAGNPILMQVVSFPGGVLTQGEVVTGGTSSATGVLIAQTTTSVSVLPLTGTFVVGETLTGGTSGRTATGISGFTPLGPTVVVTVENGSIDAGPDIVWAAASTAQVAAITFTIIADVD